MSSQPPVTPPPRPARRRAPSLVLVNTGDGKGKSTAAFGVVLRAVARGWKVCVIQFLKSGGWRTGEEELGRLFLKQQVQGGPGGPQPTGTGRAHAAPPHLGNRPPPRRW